VPEKSLKIIVHSPLFKYTAYNSWHIIKLECQTGILKYLLPNLKYLVGCSVWENK